MKFDEHGEQIRPPKWTGTEGSPAPMPESMDHMVQINTLIADLKKISEQFGNTCVYIRQFGLSWGAVALNRQAEDEKSGVFNIEERYRAILQERIDQIERLKGDRDSEREARHKADAALRQKDAAMSRLFKRMEKAGVDFSDLIP